ncbi:hypothetical protein WA1_50195 [Scytonema hofmannii PCC 7110]|uniref:Uncharacterized protein n=1 Tax=Scytonema hofmannii PCC 7110 TaxID=128403 RepID=A0A139WR42_9CYAN|nr:hypothetical protein [Scytonema hofmannii]KYC34899.1 hypothetical protein WA1_50195 [Scytonema hofmannii PCC 7110]
MTGYSRLKRWLEQHKKEVDLNGNLRLDYAEGMRSGGLSQAAIDDKAARMKARYEELKQLDETDPEPWQVYTAYDFFTESDKQQFLPDGSLKPEYVENALRSGVSMNYLGELERRQQQEVASFQRLSAQYAAQGINYGEQLALSAVYSLQTRDKSRQYLRQDILNGEEIAEIPFDVDPDTYYQQQGAATT